MKNKRRTIEELDAAIRREPGIVIGRYRLQRADGELWLFRMDGKSIGEGMQADAQELEALLEAYYQEHF